VLTDLKVEEGVEGGKLKIKKGEGFSCSPEFFGF